MTDVRGAFLSDGGVPDAAVRRKSSGTLDSGAGTDHVPRGAGNASAVERWPSSEAWANPVTGADSPPVGRSIGPRLRSIVLFLTASSVRPRRTYSSTKRLASSMRGDGNIPGAWAAFGNTVAAEIAAQSFASGALAAPVICRIHSIPTCAICCWVSWALTKSWYCSGVRMPFTLPSTCC